METVTDQASFGTVGSIVSSNTLREDREEEIKNDSP